MPPFQVHRTDLPATIGPQSWMEKIQDYYTNALKGFPPAEILKSLVGRPGDAPQVPIPLTTMIPGAAAAEGAAEEAMPAAQKWIKAYHGSGADFNKFDPKFIGTGEGGQAFGPGHYVAEAEATAKYYRDMVGGWGIKDPRTGKIVVPEEDTPEQMALIHLRDAIGGQKSYVSQKFPHPGPYAQAQKDLAETARYMGHKMTDDDYVDAKYALDAWERDHLLPEQGGHMYELNIHATPDQFLNWDKPEQSALVQKALGGVNPAVEPVDGLKLVGGGTLHVLQNPDFGPQYIMEQGGYHFSLRPEDVQNLIGGTTHGRAAFQGLTTQLGSEEAAADFLRNRGVVGNRFFDKNSRAAGKGTRNYVVYPGNEHLIEIARKYGIPLALLPTLFGQGQDTNAAQ